MNQDQLEKLKVEEDKVVVALAAMSELEKWIMYSALHAQGFRLFEARHKIRELARAT